jgi:phosphoglycolate phosphatase-like HAD superfamily hydrolase
MAVNIVTFDIDGTLVRRHPNASTLKVEAIDYAFDQVLHISDFHYLNYLQPDMYGMTDRSIMRRLMKRLGADGDLLDVELDSLFAAMFAYFDSHPEHQAVTDYYVLPGVIDLLEALKRRDYQLGIATGNFRKFADWKLNGSGIGAYFSFGGYGDDAETRSAIIAAALKRAADSDNFKACHFGDTPVDIEAAHASGILAAAVSKQAGATFESQVLFNAGADLVIDSWHDIDKILTFLNSY